MKVLPFLIFAVMVTSSSMVQATSATDMGPRKQFRFYELDGKRSPIYGHLMQEDSIFEIDLTQLAYDPPGEDKSKYTGITKGKLIRVFKGGGEIGKEFDFIGGIATWKVGDRMVIFLARNRRPILTFIKDLGPTYDDFIAAVSPFAGKISEENESLKKAVIGMRKKILKECEAAKDKRVASKCQSRARYW
jgi:hypothetical protein